MILPFLFAGARGITCPWSLMALFDIYSGIVDPERLVPTVFEAKVALTPERVSTKRSCIHLL